MRATEDKKMKDKRRIRGGHRVVQRGQRTTAGPEEDKRRTQGWPARPEDNSRSRTREGQENDKRRTQGWPARPGDNGTEKD